MQEILYFVGIIFLFSILAIGLIEGLNSESIKNKSINNNRVFNISNSMFNTSF